MHLNKIIYSDFLSQILGVDFRSFNFGVSHGRCGLNELGLMRHLFDCDVDVVDLDINVSDLVPEGVDVSAHLFAHLPRDVDGLLIAVVHYCEPEVLVQLVQGVVSGDLDLRAVDVQEAVDLDEDPLVLVLQEGLQELSLLFDVVGGERPGEDVVVQIVDALVEHLLGADLVIGNRMVLGVLQQHEGLVAH